MDEGRLKLQLAQLIVTDATMLEDYVGHHVIVDRHGDMPLTGILQSVGEKLLRLEDVRLYNMYLDRSQYQAAVAEEEVKRVVQSDVVKEKRDSYIVGKGAVRDIDLLE